MAHCEIDSLSAIETWMDEVSVTREHQQKTEARVHLPCSSFSLCMCLYDYVLLRFIYIECAKLSYTCTNLKKCLYQNCVDRFNNLQANVKRKENKRTYRKVIFHQLYPCRIGNTNIIIQPNNLISSCNHIKSLETQSRSWGSLTIVWRHLRN